MECSPRGIQSLVLCIQEHFCWSNKSLFPLTTDRYELSDMTKRAYWSPNSNSYLSKLNMGENILLWTSLSIESKYAFIVTEKNHFPKEIILTSGVSTPLNTTTGFTSRILAVVCWAYEQESLSSILMIYIFLFLRHLEVVLFCHLSHTQSYSSFPQFCPLRTWCLQTNSPSLPCLMA